MSEVNKSPPSAATASSAELPEVCLEVGFGTARSTLYVVAEAGFLIGTVPGCDLRLAGSNWPAVLCVIGRRPSGGSIRKLSMTQPVLVNGQSITTSPLVHGDRVKVGSVELVVQIQAPSSAPVKVLQGSVGTAQSNAPVSKPPPAAGESKVGGKEIETARQQLHQQIQQFRAEILRFEEDKKRFDAEKAIERKQLDEQSADLERWQKALTDQEATAKQQPDVPDTRTAERDKQLTKQLDEVAAEKQQLAAMRQELADIRTQLYDRYRERRDRLAGLQESVTLAARKVQERKQKLDAEIRDWQNRTRDEATRLAQLESQSADLQQARQLFDEERRLHESRVTELHTDVQRRFDECKLLEEKLNADRIALEKEQNNHKEDLLRFSRLRTEIDDRAKQLDDREQTLDQRLQQLQNDSKEMESQVVQLDEWHTKLSAVGEKLAKQKAEQELVSQQLAQRTAALEGQQTALAALRTRLEKMREDTRQQEQQLSEHRTHQETTEADLARKQAEIDKLREELDGEKTLVEQERRMLSDRAAVLDNAVAQLRQSQERLAADDQRVREQMQALDAANAQQTEATSLLQARITQYDELHKRVDAERENLRERSLLLAQAEQARETLQEQLRRRNDELLGRQKTLLDQAARHEADVAALQKQRGEIDQVHQQHKDELAGTYQAHQQRAAELERQEAALAARAADLDRDRAKLDEANRALADESREFVEQRAKLDIDRRAAEESAQRAAADLDAARREVRALQQQLPELELRAGTALERLTHGREQMREHLDEVHTFAGQCRDELETLQAAVQAEAERLQQQEQNVRRGQDEQRLAVAAFRQQLIDWQGQIADMKRLMATDESRLEQRHVEVTEQARRLNADTARLSQQAEQLQEKEREVALKRSEMDRHLTDMREWYRRKLRELAGVTVSSEQWAVSSEKQQGEGSESGPSDTASPLPTARRDILSLTGDVDPMDRKLGDLMRTLELIEADSLTALLVEARRQRRSLRQVLLASGAVTLYQMALIEAGNLDGLMLGPVRVIDRLRSSAHETVYRVFDPRRGAEAVLRHLAESENAAHREEYRHRFTLASGPHPNIAAALEVLEIAGRPAVLQEGLSGLASPDWPPLAGVPGVWYRLVLQAAQALHAAHEKGLAHGHLQPGHCVLTADGILKLAGFGEPPWLVSTPFKDDARADLQALAEVASHWCASQRKAARGKALPGELQSILDRLSVPGEKGIGTAAQLLDELEKAAAVVPVNPEAWDRLLRHVKENAGPQSTVRQSA